MLLELLPSALSDLKTGSNGGIKFVSSLGSVLLHFTNFRNAFGTSARGRIGPASPGLFELIHHPFRIFLVLAE